MAVTDFTIVPPASQDEEDWRRNWAAYQTRYDVIVQPLTTDIAWARLLDPASSMRGLIARDEQGNGIGFCHLVLHDSAWSLRPFCNLTDMFVAASHRRHGVGRAMLRRVIAMAEENQWARVYWTTGRGNEPARALYDSVVGGPDQMVQYTVKIKP